MNYIPTCIERVRIKIFSASQVQICATALVAGNCPNSRNHIDQVAKPVKESGNE